MTAPDPWLAHWPPRADVTVRPTVTVNDPPAGDAEIQAELAEVGRQMVLRRTSPTFRVDRHYKLLMDKARRLENQLIASEAAAAKYHLAADAGCWAPGADDEDITGERP